MSSAAVARQEVCSVATYRPIPSVFKAEARRRIFLSGSSQGSWSTVQPASLLSRQCSVDRARVLANVPRCGHHQKNEDRATICEQFLPSHTWAEQVLAYLVRNWLKPAKFMKNQMVTPVSAEELANMLTFDCDQRVILLKNGNAPAWNYFARHAQGLMASPADMACVFLQRPNREDYCGNLLVRSDGQRSQGILQPCTKDLLRSRSC